MIARRSRSGSETGRRPHVSTPRTANDSCSFTVDDSSTRNLARETDAETAPRESKSVRTLLEAGITVRKILVHRGLVEFDPGLGSVGASMRPSSIGGLPRARGPSHRSSPARGTSAPSRSDGVERVTSPHNQASQSSTGVNL